jgi:hypothetical protein
MMRKHTSEKEASGGGLGCERKDINSYSIKVWLMSTHGRVNLPGNFQSR